MQLRGGALHEPITRVWGRAPSGVQGQSPWSGGQGKAQAERHSLFSMPEGGRIWPIVKDFSVVLKLVQQSKCFFSIGTLT